MKHNGFEKIKLENKFSRLHTYMYTGVAGAGNSIAVLSNGNNSITAISNVNINRNRIVNKQLVGYSRYNSIITYLDTNHILGSRSKLNLSAISKIVLVKKLILDFWLHFRLGSLISNTKGTSRLFSKNYSLYLNFKRNRFFPHFSLNFKRDTVFNNSLGIISKHFSLKKAFLKSKSSYLMSAVYLRRVFIYLGVNISYLTIVKTPKFLKDILNSFLTNSNSLYNHPFKNSVVNEKQNNVSLYFYYVNFVNNKALGDVKRKKKGRLIRKISKKVILYNNLID